MDIKIQYTINIESNLYVFKLLESFAQDISTKISWICEFVLVGHVGAQNKTLK